MSIHISPGNSKMGKIPSVSLPPIITCDPKAKCHKQCYAAKSCKRHPKEIAAYTRNLAEYNVNPAEYFSKIYKWLDANTPEFFRWHTSGDIPDSNYFKNIIHLATCYYKTKFLVFTKKYKLVNEVLRDIAIPSNLSIILSAWGNKPPNPHKLPIAYVNDPKNNIIAPKDVIVCPGSCEDCKVCFFANQFNKDVCFNIH